MSRGLRLFIVGVLVSAGLAAAAGPAAAGVRYRVSLTPSATAITTGRSVVLHGGVSPWARGRYVTLQRYVRGGWRAVASQKLTARSRYAFTRTLQAAGTYTFRVVKPGSSRHARGVSRVVRVAVTLPVPRGFASVTLGAAHGCALKYDKSLWCWGSDSEGQLGLGGGTTNRQTPVHIGASTWRSVAAGEWSTCGVQTNGSLWCWGEFEPGTPAAGIAADHFHPTRVGTESAWAMVGAGGYASCGLRPNLTTGCWGTGDFGKPGTSSSTTPVTGVYSNWLGIAVSAYRGPTCGIRTDHHLWCFGPNGDLGDYPTQLDSGAWRSVSAGLSHLCGVKSDSTAWCWGDNTGGATGPNPTTDTPAKFDNASWRVVSAGYRFSCGIKAAGTAWCWGGNEGGRLGAGAGAPATSTVALQVGTSADWTSITAGNAYACGTRKGGSLWCWGNFLAPGDVYDPDADPIEHPVPVRIG